MARWYYEWVIRITPRSGCTLGPQEVIAQRGLQAALPRKVRNMVEILRKMSVRGSSARRGLTLLELVVVMAVLACLAGILVPVASSMIYRSHAATAATNNVEVTKAVQLYASLTNQQYPNQLDSIVDAKTGAGTPAQIATYVLYGQDAGTLAQLTFGTLLPTEVQALAAAGITTVAPMVENPNKPNTNGDYQNDWSATFFPYGNDSTATPTFAAPTPPQLFRRPW